MFATAAPRPRAKSAGTPAPAAPGATSARQPHPTALGQWAYRDAGLAALPLSRPGDRDEIEADRLAERVLSASDTDPPAPRTPAFASSPRVLRACAKCAAAGVPCHCDDEEIHRRAAGTGDGASVPAEAVHAVTRTPGQPLDGATRAFFEMRFGRGLGAVRVHADERAARSARAADALAYAAGNHVVFGAGRYAPASDSGRRLLAHELAHVVQHQQGAAPGVRRQPQPQPQPQSPSGDAPNPELERLQREWAERDERECMTDASRAHPPRCSFTGDQQARIDGFRSSGVAMASRAAAAARTGNAAMSALVRRIFHVETVDLNDVAARIDRIAAALGSWPILCATCGDPNCQSMGILRRTPSRILAVVPDHERVILVCPLFWSPEFNEANRQRTMLHEAGHAAGIDAMADYVHPTNCTGSDCENPCPDVHDIRSVDAWAWLIQCAEGVLTSDRATQAPDESRRRRLTMMQFDALGVIGRAAAAVGSGDRYMSTLATRIFGIAQPDLSSMASQIVQVGAALGARRLVVAAPGEALCASPNRTTSRAATNAVMPEDLGAIVICDTFWGLDIDAQRRELIREGVHAARLDGTRAYALTGDAGADGSCGTTRHPPDGLQSAEAWSIYIPCAAFSR